MLTDLLRVESKSFFDLPVISLFFNNFLFLGFFGLFSCSGSCSSLVSSGSIYFRHILRKLLHQLSASSVSAVQLIHGTAGPTLCHESFLLHEHCSFRVLALWTQKIFLNEPTRAPFENGGKLTYLIASVKFHSCVDLSIWSSFPWKLQAQHTRT